ncbi:Unknown protein, partial [Striga hermonthica]
FTNRPAIIFTIIKLQSSIIVAIASRCSSALHHRAAPPPCLRVYQQQKAASPTITIFQVSSPSGELLPAVAESRRTSSIHRRPSSKPSPTRTCKWRAIRSQHHRGYITVALVAVPFIVIRRSILVWVILILGQHVDTCPSSSSKSQLVMLGLLPWLLVLLLTALRTLLGKMSRLLAVVADLLTCQAHSSMSPATVTTLRRPIRHLADRLNILDMRVIATSVYSSTLVPLLVTSIISLPLARVSMTRHKDPDILSKSVPEFTGFSLFRIDHVSSEGNQPGKSPSILINGSGTLSEIIELSLLLVTIALGNVL